MQQLVLLFTVPFEFKYRYWNQAHIKHENLFSIYIIGIRAEARQRIIAAHSSRGIHFSVYLYLIIELCLFV